MNRKALIFMVMMCIIAILLVRNFIIFNGSGDDIISLVNSETQKINNVENETEPVTSECSVKESEWESMEDIYKEESDIVFGIDMGSLPANYDFSSGGQSVIFGTSYEEYFNSTETYY